MYIMYNRAPDGKRKEDPREIFSSRKKIGGCENPAVALIEANRALRYYLLSSLYLTSRTGTKERCVSRNIAMRRKKKRKAKIRELREDLLIPIHSPRFSCMAHKNKQRQNIKQGALYVDLFIFSISGRAECPNAFRNTYAKEARVRALFNLFPRDDRDSLEINRCNPRENKCTGELSRPSWINEIFETKPTNKVERKIRVERFSRN